MGEFLNYLGSFSYLIGCWLLVPASVYLGSSDDSKLSIIIYIISCAFLTVAALFEFIPAIAAFFGGTVRSQETESLVETTQEDKTEKVKKLIIKICYVIGGILFELGSVLYWPELDKGAANYGTWSFRFGSFFYLTGSLISLKGLLGYYGDKKIPKDLTYLNWLGCLVFYMAGSIFFLIGGLMSQLNISEVATIWLWGSIFFGLGSTFCFIEVSRGY